MDMCGIKIRIFLKSELIDVASVFINSRADAKELLNCKKEERKQNNKLSD